MLLLYYWSELVFVLVNLMAILEGCPIEVCICKWKNGKQMVECGGQSLPNIPEGMDPGTQVLNFSGNALQVLQSERFLRMDLLNLQKIYLSRNQLIRVHEKAFRGLRNLVELDLSDNALQQIPTETFQDYSSLMRLTLSGNPIRELKTAAFRYLSFLTTLELSNCQIEHIENEAFIGMDNLEWLRLDGNRIGFIQGANILPKSLHGISLQSNRWTCDCRLLDVHLWLTTYSIPQTEEPKCVEPNRLKGQTIKTIQRKELACLPEVTPQSSYAEVSEGRNLSMSCIVRAIPEPELFWLFNGNLMSNDSFSESLIMHYNMEESSTVPEEKHSELFIYSVGAEDNGTFSCVGQNIAGSTMGNYTIRVLIKEPPVVNEVSFPQNYMNYIVGSSAGGGIIFLILLCTVLIKCKRREKPSESRKCPATVVTSVTDNSNTVTADGTMAANSGLMKCSSIINDNEVFNGGSGLILSNSESLSPTKLNKQNGHLFANNQLKQNILLYAPLKVNNQALQLSVNRANVSALSSATPPPQLPPPLPQSPSLLINPEINNTLTYSSPPSSLRNYTDKNPDLVNDAEIGVKYKLKPSASMEATATEYDANSACISPVQYEQYYHQLGPQLPTAKIMRPNLVTAVGAPQLSTLNTLPRGMQLKTIMSSLPSHPSDIHLNPVCFLGHSGISHAYSKTDLLQSNNRPPNTLNHPAHSQQHAMQPIQQQPLQQQLPQQQQQQQQQQQLPQQNFYRTLPHNRTHKQHQYIGANLTANGVYYSNEAEILQQRTDTFSYEKYNLPNIRFTAEGYPQYVSPPEGYKSNQSSTPGTTANSTTAPAITLQQWPTCLPGYHAQSVRFPFAYVAMDSNALKTTQQQQSSANTGDLSTMNSMQTTACSSSSTSISITCASSLPTTSTSLPQMQSSNTKYSTTIRNSADASQRCASSQVELNSPTIPECDEIENSPTSVSTTNIAAHPINAEANAIDVSIEEPVNKPRHLHGPLADSPDEGYVGETNDAGEM